MTIEFFYWQYDIFGDVVMLSDIIVMLSDIVILGDILAKANIHSCCKALSKGFSCLGSPLKHCFLLYR